MNNKISVIVPAYNSEKYIRKCIESIVNQTYKNIEILIVDNNSSDRTGEIVKAYSEKNDNIHYFFCEERGAAAARNYGIDRCTGEYICFVDADDYVEETYCEVLLDTIIKRRADICVCGIKRIKENGDLLKKCFVDDFLSKSMADFEETILLMYENLLLNSPVNKLYKKSIISIKFNNKFQIGEDLLFNLELMKEDNLKICGTSKILYNYIIFDGLSSEKLQYYSKNRLEATLYLYKEMKDIGLKYGYSKEYSKVIDRIYGDKIIFCYKEWSVLNELFEEKKRKVAKLVGSKEISEINVKYINSIPKKIIFVLFKIKAVSFLTFMLMVTGDKDANNK